MTEARSSSKIKISRWRRAAAVIASATTLVLAACATNLGTGTPSAELSPSADGPGNAKRSRPVKIAMLLPLGGFDRTAAIAKSMKQAGEMALFERDDPRIQLVVKDDKGTPAGAKAAADEAVREGAEIILGPLFSKAVAGAAPVAKAANIPLVAFSNDRAVAGNGVYLMSFLPEPEVERIVSFAASQGKRRFAALIPNDAYGRKVSDTFRRVASRTGVTIVALETYAPGANAMIDPAQKVFDIIKQANEMGAPVDALFLPGGQDVLPSIGPMLAYSGVDTNRVKLLGTGAWEFPNIGRDAAFVGGWYPSPDPRGWKEFSGRFARNFGQAPPRLATLAYDAVNMAIELSAYAPGTRYTAQNLTRSNGFRGVDGVVRFTAGGLAERGLAILEVQKFGSTVVDAAPTSLYPGRRSGGAYATGSIRATTQPSATPRPSPNFAGNNTAPSTMRYASPAPTIEPRPNL